MGGNTVRCVRGEEGKGGGVIGGEGGHVNMLVDHRLSMLHKLCAMCIVLLTAPCLSLLLPPWSAFQNLSIAHVDNTFPCSR